MSEPLQVALKQFRVCIGCPELAASEIAYRCVLFLPAFCLIEKDIAPGSWVLLTPDSHSGNPALQPVACQVQPEFAQLVSESLYVDFRPSPGRKRHTEGESTEKKRVEATPENSGEEEEEDADIVATPTLLQYLVWTIRAGLRKEGTKLDSLDEITWSIVKLVDQPVVEVKEVYADPVFQDRTEDGGEYFDISVSHGCSILSRAALHQQQCVWARLQGFAALESPALILHSGKPYIVRSCRLSTTEGLNPLQLTVIPCLRLTRHTRVVALGSTASLAGQQSVAKQLLLEDGKRLSVSCASESCPPILAPVSPLFHHWFARATQHHVGRDIEISMIIRKFADALAFSSPNSSKDSGASETSATSSSSSGHHQPALTIPRAAAALYTLSPARRCDADIPSPSSLLLIEGPSGSGKSHLAKTLAETAPFPSVYVSAAELFKSSLGETEAALHSVFARAMTSAVQRPNDVLQAVSKSNAWYSNAALVVIDDIDTLTPARGSFFSRSGSSVPTRGGNDSISLGSPADMYEAAEDGSSSGRNVRLENRTIDLLTELLDSVQHPPAITQTWRIPRRVLDGELEASNGLASNGLDLYTNVQVQTRPRVFVIATTSRLHAVHPLLLRSDRFALAPLRQRGSAANHGLFGTTLSLGSLAHSARLKLLKHYLQLHNIPNDYETVLDRVARRMHGYVVSDVVHLVTEAYMYALRRRDSKQQDDGFIIEEQDFNRALAAVGAPSALRISGLLLTLPEAEQDSSDLPESSIASAFEEVGGRGSIVELLHREVVWPMVNRRQWIGIIQSLVSETKYGRVNLTPGTVAPSSGILICGGPGSGKTYLALALARASSLPVLNISATSIISKVHGGSEAALERVFSVARASAPCMLLLDQIEAICARDSPDGSNAPSKLLSAVIAQLDDLQRARMHEEGISSSSDTTEDSSYSLNESMRDVIVVGTTSFPQRLDPSLFMPGRFETHIMLDDLDADGRFDVLVKLTKSMPVKLDSQASGSKARVMDEARIAFNESVLRDIASDQLTGGWTPADLKALTAEAAMDALRDARRLNLRKDQLHSLHVSDIHVRNALARIQNRFKRS